MKEINDFINSTRRNAWLSMPFISLYVRKARRIINRKAVYVFDLASLDVDEDKQGTGILTGIVNYIESGILDDFDGIYVENIMSQRLLNWFLKQGYVIVSDQEPDKCVFKPLK